MRENILKILVCPDCGNELELIKSNKKSRIIGGERIEEIWDGILKCKNCGRLFPITRGVVWIYPKNLMRKDIINKLISSAQRTRTRTSPQDSE